MLAILPHSMLAILTQSRWRYRPGRETWVKIKTMRNHIVHGYWQIDFRVIVDTIENDLEPLKITTQRLIELAERTTQ